jgi:hypothetical protein
VKDRRRANNWFLLGIIPPYPRTVVEKQADKKIKELKFQYLGYYHACLSAILQDLLQLDNNPTGCPLNIPGLGCYYLHFKLSYIIGDTKGHEDMCNRYNVSSSCIQRLCRDCNIPQAEADNPFFCCQPTQAVPIISRIKRFITLNSQLSTICGTSKAAKETRKELKSQLKTLAEELKGLSQHPVLSAYFSFDFSESSGGVYLSTPFEMLHQFQSGFCKSTLSAIFNRFDVHKELQEWYKNRFSKNSKKRESGQIKKRPKVSPATYSRFPKAEMEARVRFSP